MAILDASGNVVPLNGTQIYLGLFSWNGTLDNDELAGDRFVDTQNGVATFDLFGTDEEPGCRGRICPGIWGAMDRSCSASPSNCAELRLRRVAPLSEVNPSRAGKRAAVYGLRVSRLRDVAEPMGIAGRNRQHREPPFEIDGDA